MPRATKSALHCAKFWECCYRILQIMIQIGCKTFLGNVLAAYSSESETHQYLPGYLPCHESWCVWIMARRNFFFYQQLMKSLTNALIVRTLLQNILFFNDYYPGRQLARKVLHPQLQSVNLTFHLLSLNSRPALLIKQHRLSGRISSAWWSPTVRPEHSERRDLGCQIVRLVRCYSSNKYGDYV